MPPPNAAAWYEATLLAYTTATGVLLLRRAAATRTTTGLFTAGLMAVATAVHVPRLLHEPPRCHKDDFWRWTVFPAMNALLGAIWLTLVLYYNGATTPPAPFVLLVAAFWGLKVWYFRYEHAVQGWEKPWVDVHIDVPMVAGLCLSLLELQWHRRMWFAPLMADLLYHLTEPLACVGLPRPRMTHDRIHTAGH